MGSSTLFSQSSLALENHSFSPDGLKHGFSTSYPALVIFGSWQWPSHSASTFKAGSLVLFVRKYLCTNTCSKMNEHPLRPGKPGSSMDTNWIFSFPPTAQSTQWTSSQEVFKPVTPTTVPSWGMSWFAPQVPTPSPSLWGICKEVVRLKCLFL